MIRTDSMWLVYEDEQGLKYYQSWQGLTDVGTLIDPETGEDMVLVGWVDDRTEEGEALAYLGVPVHYTENGYRVGSFEFDSLSDAYDYIETLYED